MAKASSGRNKTKNGIDKTPGADFLSPEMVKGETDGQTSSIITKRNVSRGKPSFHILDVTQTKNAEERAYGTC